MIHPEHTPEFTANETKEQSFDFVSISIASPEEIVQWTGEQFLDELDEHGNRKVKGLKEVRALRPSTTARSSPSPTVSSASVSSARSAITSAIAANTRR